ncbi:chloride channel protein [Mangrovibacterium diazotrophicum]|uniref:CIC family chloride channel protein n=1 Tax=Mangrovibacterium diazotrophicum TaxID=1261403 RepID=A0A419W5G2_9BACT|nr:chloride channel protein [Mangrovibacterium diazotrophicum]RKD90699.1 CIC family chloride channel protein [Mangrovibacterium diazotrophicum]
MMELKTKLLAFFNRMNDSKKVYWLSLLIGIVCGTAALLLKNLIHLIGETLVGNLKESDENYLFLAFPLIGIAITVLIVKLLIKDDLGHGVSKVLGAISLNKGNLKRHHTFSSMITSSFTIGFGGSVGAEAPVVLTGSAIGSNLARFFNLSHAQTMLMLGCGATGAIAGIFKAPLAGIVFTLEVLMLDLTMASLLPLLISGISAAVLAYYFMGDEVLFKFELVNSFDAGNIPFYLILGVFSGFISLYFTRMTMYLERRFKLIRKPINKILIGGLILGLCIFLFPPLWGEGYHSIDKIFNGLGPDLLDNSLFFNFKDQQWFIVIFLLLLVFIKVIAMTATTASGGVGGIFAPTLFVGAIGGYFVASFFNLVLGLNLPIDNFALAGMGAMMAGVMHAPLLGIFLTAEITGGYQLFFPLIIAAIASYVTIMAFEPYSIYTKALAKKGELVTHHKDKAVLHFMAVRELIETDFAIVSPEATLGDLTKIIAKSKRNLFPVVDDEGMMKGMIKMDDIREIIFNHELYDKIYVKDLMYMPEHYISPRDTMLKVAEKFESSARFNLAVLDNGKYLGFISRARVFSNYRNFVRTLSHD